MPTKAIVKKEKPGALIPLEPWETDMQQQASTERSQETQGVPRITTRAMVLKVDGKVVEGGKLKLAIVDYVHEKRYTIGDFDPNDTRPPDCYAQARPMPGEKTGDTENRMVAHTAAPEKQNLKEDGTSPCRGCRHNAFHTAKVGKGKACKDYRKLLVFSPRIGNDGKPVVDEDAVEKGALYQIDVPPSGLKDWGGFLSRIEPMLRTGNIREAIIQVSLESLPNGGHKPVFDFIGPVARDGLKSIYELGKSRSDLLMQPWPVRKAEEAKEPVKPLKGQEPRRRK
jgi:hypothetical protein